MKRMLINATQPEERRLAIVDGQKLLDFETEIEELLALDDGEAALFGLRRVDQHAFHVHSYAATGGVAGGSTSCVFLNWLQ